LFMQDMIHLFRINFKIEMGKVIPSQARNEVALQFFPFQRKIGLFPGTVFGEKRHLGDKSFLPCAFFPERPSFMWLPRLQTKAGADPKVRARPAYPAGSAAAVVAAAVVIAAAAPVPVAAAAEQNDNEDNDPQTASAAPTVIAAPHCEYLLL